MLLPSFCKTFHSSQCTCITSNLENENIPQLNSITACINTDKNTLESVKSNDDTKFAQNKGVLASMLLSVNSESNQHIYSNKESSSGFSQSHTKENQLADFYGKKQCTDSHSLAGSLPVKEPIDIQDIRSAEVAVLNFEYGSVPTDPLEKNVLICKIHQENPSISLDMLARWAGVPESDVLVITRWVSNEWALSVGRLHQQYGKAPSNKAERDMLICKIHQENKLLPIYVIASWSNTLISIVSKVISQGDNYHNLTIDALNQKYGLVPENWDERKQLIFKIYMENEKVTQNLLSHWAGISQSVVSSIIWEQKASMENVSTQQVDARRDDNSVNCKRKRE